MSVNFKELLNKLQSGEIVTTSKFKLRDENIQSKNNTKAIPMLKREKKKKSKLLIQTELAIPFDPFTGKVTEQYNPDSKFRPIMAQSTLMKALKSHCNENEEVKAIYMAKAGVEEWNTSDVDSINEVDRKIFRRYRVARKFTLPVVHINIPVLTGTGFGRDYTIKVVRDENTGMINGEWPMPLRANKIFNDMAYEHIKEIKAKSESGEEPLNEKDMTEKIRKIYSDIPVSSDYPVNYVIAYEIPLDQSFDFSNEDFTGVEKEDMFKHQVLIKCSKEILSALENYETGSYKAIDHYDEFWEFDMKCPTDTDDKAQIGLNTKYEKPMSAVKEAKWFADLYKAAVELADDSAELEKIFMRSARIRPYDDDVEVKFLDALRTVLEIKNNPYLTEGVIKASADFISVVFGEKGDELIAEAQVGLVAEGNLDEKESADMGKQYNVEAIVNGGGSVDVEEVDLELQTEGATA